MVIFLGAFLVVDAAIILSAYYNHVVGAAQTCSAVAPLSLRRSSVRARILVALLFTFS